jgi:hypothetical protein
MHAPWRASEGHDVEGREKGGPLRATGKEEGKRGGRPHTNRKGFRAHIAPWWTQLEKAKFDIEIGSRAYEEGSTLPVL